MKIKTFITYGIRDPRTGLFVYVGQSENYEKRKRAHLTLRGFRPRIKSTNIKTWMFDILSAGVTPEFVIVESTDNEEASLISEFSWVKKLRSENHPLLNHWKIHRAAFLMDEADDEKRMATAITSIQGYLANKKTASRDYSGAALSHAKKPWLPSENKKLMELYAQGMGGQEIAKLLCRPFRGVCARLVRLGVVPDRNSVRE